MKSAIVVVAVLVFPAICLAYLQGALNYDRKVDFSDFAAFADEWLLAESPDEPNSIGPAAADYVIAASDTVARMKAKADYVCDGIDWPFLAHALATKTFAVCNLPPACS
jgi:hypothetical protein